jgi:outer membrane protein assembly factor BamB
MKTIFIILFTVICLSVHSQVTQWRGPNRDGIFPETGLLKVWPAEGPKLLFEVEGLGKGWSSPIATADAIYITGMKDTLDYLTKMDANGKILWQVPYGRSWNQSFPDTRASATVDGDRVYVQSGTGRVVCFNAADGKENWAVEVDKKYEGEYHNWGNAETPLIYKNLVIATPGGKKTSVVALNKMNGELIWETKSLDGPRAYVSATVYKYKDLTYILAATGTDLIAVNPDNGNIAWSYKYYDAAKWDQPGLIWANTPVFKDDEIFLTMGYDYKAVMLKMASDGRSVSEKFVNTVFDNHHHGVILYNGYLYGSNWQNNSKGRWVCMDWSTGEIKYETEWDTKGAMVMADGMLYCYNEKGNVGLVKPDPSGFQVVSQFKVTKGGGTHWAHPFIANGKLYLRHGEVMMVYNIKAQ